MEIGSTSRRNYPSVVLPKCPFPQKVKVVENLLYMSRLATLQYDVHKSEIQVLRHLFQQLHLPPI